MAQIIKHRRGTPEQLKAKTLNAAEIGVSTGSFFSGTPIVHIGDGANAAGYVVGRLHYGSTPPTLNCELIVVGSGRELNCQLEISSSITTTLGYNLVVSNKIDSVKKV